jgi:hypothetical protein
MSNISYPFDTTGIASTNFIQNEQHTVTEANYRDYFFIVPIASPFFIDNLKVYLILNNVTTELLEGIGYNLALPFIGASRSIGKMVYGAITLTDSITTGEILISYQTLGGSWVCDQQQVLNVLAEKVYNPRTVTWDEVTNVQETFPPINHTEEYDDVYGQEGVINSLIDIADAIALASGNSSNVTHFTDYNNPHQTTALQVGLGLVENLQVVSDAEIAAGVPVRKYVTYDELLKYTPANTNNTNTTAVDLATHIADHNNPHVATATQLGLGLVENLPVVTQATMDAGVATHEYLTFDRIGKYTDHLTDNTNPHRTTSTQVGLGLVENLSVVTQAESLSSTSVHKYVTQDRLLNSILPTLGNLTVAAYGVQMVTVNLPIITANGYDMAGVSLQVQYRLATDTLWTNGASIPFVNGKLSYNSDIINLDYATTYQAQVILVDSNNPNLVDISNTIQFTTLYSSLDPDSQFDIVGLTYINTNVISGGAAIINNVGTVSNPYANVSSIEITQQLGEPDFDKLIPTVAYEPAQLCVDPSSTLQTLVVKSKDLDVVVGETLTTVENGTLINYNVNSVTVTSSYANRPSNYNICNAAPLVDFSNLSIDAGIVNNVNGSASYFAQVILTENAVNFIGGVDSVNNNPIQSHTAGLNSSGNIVNNNHISFTNSCYASVKVSDRIYVFGNNNTGQNASAGVLSTIILPDGTINDTWYTELNSLPAPIIGGVAYTVGNTVCLLTSNPDVNGVFKGLLYVSNIGSDGSLGPWSDVSIGLVLPPTAVVFYGYSNVFVFETNNFRYCIGGSAIINGNSNNNNNNLYSQANNGSDYTGDWSVVDTLAINNDNIADVVVDTNYVYLFTNSGTNSNVYVATINPDGTLSQFTLAHTLTNVLIDSAFVTLSKIYVIDNSGLFYSVPYKGWPSTNSAEINTYTLDLTPN